MIIIVMIRDKHGKEQIVCLADDHRKNRHHTSLFVRNCKLVRSLTSSSALFCHCLPSFSSSSYFERNQAIRFPLSSTILNGKVSDKYLQKWYFCQTSRTCKSVQHLQSLPSSFIMKMMISLSLRSKLLREISGAITPPGLRGGGAKCFQARRVEMDHPSGCHDDG